MLALPQRREFASRDDFAAAVLATFQELFTHYDVEPVRHVEPDWAGGAGVYNVRLPLKMALDEGGAPHGISSIVKHAIEMQKSAIGRIARVERDGQWIVFFEAT